MSQPKLQKIQYEGIEAKITRIVVTFWSLSDVFSCKSRVSRKHCFTTPYIGLFVLFSAFAIPDSNVFYLQTVWMKVHFCQFQLDAFFFFIQKPTPLFAFVFLYYPSFLKLKLSTLQSFKSFYMHPITLWYLKN